MEGGWGFNELEFVGLSQKSMTLKIVISGSPNIANSLDLSEKALDQAMGDRIHTKT